jgi:HlyD family secretion protein
MIRLRASRITGVAIFVLAAGGGAWYYYRPRPVPVTVRIVDRGPVARTIANTRAGSIKACRRSKLALTSGGQIARIYVKKGDHVRVGQPLLGLWNADLRDNVSVLEEEVTSNRLHVHELCARADLAERDSRRAHKLRSDQLIAEEQYDKVASEARALAAQCDAGRADVATSEARLQLARTQLAKTVLTAPYSGRIGDITGELGEFTTPSPPGIPTPPAVDLIDDSCYYVSAPVDEIDAGSLRVGMPALISVDAFPGTRFPGRVRRIADYVLEVEKQARTVEVEVEFTMPPDKNLVVGYSADVEITPQAKVDVVRVPTQSILKSREVLTYNAATRRLASRPLKTGLSNWEYTEVVSGLEAGEQVVMSLDRAGVKDGASVIVENPGGKP